MALLSTLSASGWFWPAVYIGAGVFVTASVMETSNIQIHQLVEYTSDPTFSKPMSRAVKHIEVVHNRPEIAVLRAKMLYAGSAWEKTFVTPDNNVNYLRVRVWMNKMWYMANFKPDWEMTLDQYRTFSVFKINTHLDD